MNDLNPGARALHVRMARGGWHQATAFASLDGEEFELTLPGDIVRFELSSARALSEALGYWHGARETARYCCPQEWAARTMPFLGELAQLLGGSEDSFTGELLRMMRKADSGNRYRLAQAFPVEARALQLWEDLSPATFGELYQALTDQHHPAE